MTTKPFVATKLIKKAQRVSRHSLLPNQPFEKAFSEKKTIANTRKHYFI